MLPCFLNIKHVNLFKKVEPENEQCLLQKNQFLKKNFISCLLLVEWSAHSRGFIYWRSEWFEVIATTPSQLGAQSVERLKTSSAAFSYITTSQSNRGTHAPGKVWKSHFSAHKTEVTECEPRLACVRLYMLKFRLDFIVGWLIQVEVCPARLTGETINR